MPEREEPRSGPTYAPGVPRAADALIRSVVLKRDRVDPEAYPFSIPAIRQLDELELDPHVTLLAGENGSGKSTLVEAIAIAAGYNAEGGSRHMTVSTRPSHSALHEHVRLVRGTRRPRTGYFLRAESGPLGARRARVDAAHARPHRGGLAVHDLDALAGPAGVSRSADLRALGRWDRADAVRGHRRLRADALVPRGP